MPQLVALYDAKGDWDVFVVEGLQQGVLNPVRQAVDVLGRRLPDWVGARSLGGIKPSETDRLARELKGLSMAERRSLCEEQSQGRSLTYFGSKA